ncbi:MAG: hypothetical protein HRT47_02360 [Candidatus Caenarcaniphilales bacterium]|nr:hypothetical protein [Candidatus Caenarcaniphilales bacterium]
MMNLNTLKTFLTKMTLLGSIALISTPSQAAESLFSPESKDLFNIEFIRPEKEENPSLEKEVNLSFYETRVSEILFTISKIGEFNLVYPKNLDKKISINLHKRSISEAIEDILHTAKLKSSFENNTLKVYTEDLRKLEFYNIATSYSSSKLVSKLLNEHLFKQIIISQDKNLPKPYSFVNPANNDLTIAANPEQFRIAKNFINSIDHNQDIKVIKLKYLSSIKAERIVKENFPNLQTEKKVKQIILTGNAASNILAEKLIEKVDLPGSLQDLYVEYFLVKEHLNDRQELYIKEFLVPATLMKIPEAIYANDRFQQLQSSLKPLFKEKLKLDTDSIKRNIRGTNIEVIPVSKESYVIKMRNQTNKIMDKNLIVYLDRAKNLFSDKYLKKNMRNRLVLVMMKLD